MYAPFVGVAHVWYLPGERIAGLSKLARLVEHTGAVPQVQERMTKQIAETLDAELTPRGVVVVIEAQHSTQRKVPRPLRTLDVRRSHRYCTW